MQKKINRCFGNGKDFYEEYHDKEWGVPCYSDQMLFELLILEGAQAGLSWELILKRRENYRKLFYNFDPKTVAEMTDQELEVIVTNPLIIRNKRKIYSARENAKVFLKIQKEFGSFSKFIWAYSSHKPTVNHWEDLKSVPCSSPLSDQISKELKRRGMSFVGTKIIYSYLQAIGVINDHLVDCPRHKACQL